MYYKFAKKKVSGSNLDKIFIYNLTNPQEPV